MHDSKDKTVALLCKSKFKFATHNLLSAAILDFGEGYKSCSYCFQVNKSHFNVNLKHIETKNMTSAYSSA